MKINQIKKLLLGGVLLTSMWCWAQKEVQGIAYYKSSNVVDVSGFGDGNMDAERQKRIAERVKNMLDKTYILTFNQVESMYQVVEDDNNDGNRWGGMMNSFANGPQYKNIKDQKFIQDQEFFGKQFLIKDDLQKIDWKMTNETKKIGDYMCLKATTTKTVPNNPMNFRRFGANEDQKEPETKTIEVEAWYSLQIPINQGPDGYWGLPGLILELKEDNKTLYCSKIVMNPEEKVAIEKPSKGKEVTKAEYDKIVKKKTEEMRSQFRIREGQPRR